MHPLHSTIVLISNFLKRKYKSTKSSISLLPFSVSCFKKLNSRFRDVTDSYFTGLLLSVSIRITQLSAAPPDYCWSANAVALSKCYQGGYKNHMWPFIITSHDELEVYFFSSLPNTVPPTTNAPGRIVPRGIARAVWRAILETESSGIKVTAATAPPSEAIAPAKSKVEGTFRRGPAKGIKDGANSIAVATSGNTLSEEASR